MKSKLFQLLLLQQYQLLLLLLCCVWMRNECERVRSEACFWKLWKLEKKTCLPRFSWIILVSYWSARDKLKQKEQKQKNNNTMLAISNWTKNGLSHQTETKTEARKSYNERKTDRPEPLSDLNHQRIGGDRQTGIPHPLILRCCLFFSFALFFQLLNFLCCCCPYFYLK